MAFVGLDLGTSNCCAYTAAADAAPAVVPSLFGAHLTPSCVAYTESQVLVGEAAQQQQTSNPLNTFVEFKRVIGRTYDQRELWQDARHWPFQLLPPEPDEPDGAPRYCAVHCGDVLRCTARQLYSTMATALLRAARDRIGAAVPLLGVTVTVPAHFDHAQRAETLAAVRAAGVPAEAAVQVLNEPTAAVIAYAAARAPLPPGTRLVVFDLGAGTLDATCLAARGEGRYDVLGSEGCCDLGGTNFDQRLVAMAAAHFKKHTGRDLRTKAPRLAAVRAACERAKRTLSVAGETAIHVADDVPALAVTRRAFEAAIAKDLRRCADQLRRLLQAAGVAAAEVEHVVLCGGSSRVPAVRAAVAAVLPDAGLRTDLNADECVAHGACLHARSTAPPDSAPGPPGPGAIVVQDVLTRSIGIRTGENVMLVLLERGTPLPATATQTLLPIDERDTYVDLCVYQGEAPNTDDNVYLGSVRLRELRPGRPELQLTIEVDGGAVVHVDAGDDDGHRVVGDMDLPSA